MSIVTLLNDTLKYCIEKYQLPPITLRFGKCGRVGKQSITIRVFWHRPEELTIATLLHQVAHLILYAQRDHTHNKQFKDTERMLLAEFGLCPVGYNNQTSHYTTLMTIDKRHRWKTAVAFNRTDMVEGTFSALNMITNPIEEPRPQSRPQLQQHIRYTLQYVRQVCSVHPDQGRLKKIHQRFHPGTC